MTTRSRVNLLVALVLIFAAVAIFAQDASKNPDFLIARPELPNQLFEKSVILMFPRDDRQPELVVGVIVNKPTRKRLSDVFPGEGSLSQRTDHIYLGGPIGIDTPGAIFRAPKAPSDNAIHILADVYVTFDLKTIVSLLKRSKPDAAVRVFLGRAQWGNEQLQNEMLRRAWYREPAEPALVFSPSPEDLWQTLVKRAESGPIALLQCDLSDASLSDSDRRWYP